MHTAALAPIGVDRSCNLVARKFNDKMVRLWSLPDGQLVNTLRPPIGPGDDGKAYAVALPPPGSPIGRSRWMECERLCQSIRR